MATLTADRAQPEFGVYKPTGAGALAFAYGVYELTANPSVSDIIEFCKVPAGAVIVDGFLRGDDIDTGTETLDIDIGVSGNADQLGNFGVITGDAVVGVKPEVQIWMPLNGELKDGPVSVTAETTIIGTVNAVAQAGGTGTLYLGVYYLAP